MDNNAVALAVNVKGVSSDWQAAFGDPVVLAETFVDLQQSQGTRYIGAGREAVGQTSGHSRVRGEYHGGLKKVLSEPLVPKVQEKLSALILPSEACEVENGTESPVDLTEVLPGREKTLLDYLR